MNRTAFILLTIIASFFAPNFADAFEVNPIGIELGPSGRRSSGVVTVKNASSRAKAVEVKMVTREPDEYGVEDNKSAEDFFLVYPSQLILPPNSERTVRISWIGDPKPSEELAYRFIAEELDIDVSPTAEKDEDRSMVKVLLRYEGVVYIEPSNVSGEIVLEKSGLVQEGGQILLSLQFKNIGSKHQLLRDLNLKIKVFSEEGEKTLSFGPQELKGVNGANLLPGKERKFKLILEGVSHSSPVEVDFTYDSSF